MRKLLIILIIFISCSKDTVFNEDEIIIIDPIETKCNCQKRIVQVTIAGNHITHSSSNVLINCSDNGLIFNKKYNGTRLIQYSIYNCD